MKSKEATASLGSLEGEVAIGHLQIKKKEERVRALEEEIFLDKNKFCNLELDLKKQRLEYEMMERNQKEELQLLQRRLTLAEDMHNTEKEEENRKLTAELEMKEERYTLLLGHLNQEREDKEELIRNNQLQQLALNGEKQNSYDKDHIAELEGLISSLKTEKNSKTFASESVLSSIMQKLSELNSSPNQ